MRQAESRSRLMAFLSSVVADERVLHAMGQTPRERFVDERLRGRAYQNCALPIGKGQTISQPSLVAMMTEALTPQPSDVVLDIGTGSGYQAAVLAPLVKRVVSVERVSFLASRARRLLQDLGHTNVEVHVAVDELGWPAAAPYDGIVVAAAAPDVPGLLVDQLAIGGRLVIPVGTMSEQALVRVVRTATGTRETRLLRCRFVPLIGPGSWSAEEAKLPLSNLEA